MMQCSWVVLEVKKGRVRSTRGKSTLEICRDVQLVCDQAL